MRRTRAIFVIGALMAAYLPTMGGSASAVEAPVAFSATAAPTYQTNGVAYAVASSGGLVFVGGAFSSVRPPGAATGQSEQVRNNLVVLDAATGSPTSCAPSVTNGSDPSQAVVRDLAVSPDGRTLYVAGSFTTVQGVPKQHLAAIDISTCTLQQSFTPLPGGAVLAVTATATSVYFGGTFSVVQGNARTNAAAVTAVGTATPGAILPWAPRLDGELRAVAVRPGGSAVVIGGTFGTVNGADSHALAVVDSVGTATGTATVATYPGGFVPPNSIVKAIKVDASGFYTGNEGTGSGVFDGRIAVDWTTYSQRWRDTCLGATQALEIYQGVLYSGSHAHDCSSMGEYSDGARHHLLGQSVNDPKLLSWFPDTDDGTNEHIGPRDLVVADTGSSPTMYVVGEFTTVNGSPQQGISRFPSGNDTTAPSAPTLSLTSPHAGQVRVAWRLALDPDDATLTYTVYRDGSSMPLQTSTRSSQFWTQRQMSFTDTTVAPGSSHSYRIGVTDGTNTTYSPWRSVFVAAVTSAYRDRVLADGASFLWRYDEPGDVYLADDTTNDANGQLLGSASFQVVPAAVKGDSSRAYTINSGSTLYSVPRYPAPTTFTAETWFKTTTTAGGKIIGFGNRQTGMSSSYDKHIYMTADGHVVFGVYAGAFVTLRSAKAYNDGTWHHVAATQGPQGMDLYLDGAAVGHGLITTNQSYDGYWRVGGDNVAGWPGAPSSGYWTGTLDETAVYPSALSAASIADHYAIATGSATQQPPTPTDRYGAAVVADGPLAYWRLGETAGPVAVDTSGNGRSGVYSAGLTYGQPAAVEGTTDTAVGLSGDPTGQVASASALPSLSSYSEEGWLRTTSTSGGKLFGFGSSQSANSGTYDRHVYMTNDGHLVFGVFTGTTVTVSSPAVYNDGRWHHVVATQGSTGMTLWVDGRSVGSSPETGHDMSSAFWRVGGDNLAGWPNAPTSAWLNGFIDEASLYDKALTPTQVAAHFGAGRPSATDNTPPSTPASVSASTSAGDVRLSWQASTDDNGVTGYEVHRSATSGFTPTSSTLLRTVSTTSTVDTAVGVGTWYYRVIALDVAGNHSAPSAEVSATVTDTVAPSVPSGVTASTSPNTTALSWTASSDNVGVTQYAVYRSTTAGTPASDSTRLAYVTGTSWMDTSVPAGRYYYRVAAMDAAGNVSAASDEAAATVPPAMPGSTYRPLDPHRLLDTRNGTGAPVARVGPKATLTLQVTGPAGSGLAPTGSTAVVLNVTATNPSTNGFVAVYPTGYAGGPNTSNLNFVAGQTTPNLVVSKVAADGSVTLYNQNGSVDLIADLQGSYTPDSAGSTYRPLDPHRLLDTRNGTGAPVATVGPKATLTLQVTGPAGSGLAPTGSTAVVLNVTATNPSTNGFVAVYPTGYAGGPNTSNLNFVAGQTTPNLVVSKVAADGSVTLYNQNGSVDLIADLQGSYTP